MTDTPSTLDEKLKAKGFGGLARIEIKALLKQELAAFADEVEAKTILKDKEMQKIWSINAQFRGGYDAACGEILAVLRIIKHRYGLMEGEKHE